jgi:AbrB family looped-hinge helix DNA binding protein
MIMAVMAMNRTQMAANGRVVIPAGIRRELGFEPGEELVVRLRDGRIELERPADLLKRMQREWQAAARGRSMVDDLLTDRRREFKREEEELKEWLRSRSSTRQP